MLRIEPDDYITFKPGDNTESGFKLTSISKIPITFKIQTTSPEKFRVRPRCGVLGPDESLPVGILLKTEHKLSDSTKDKFLVMAMPAPTTDMTANEVAELWKIKPTNSPDIEQHRLICQYTEGALCNAGGSSGVVAAKDESTAVGSSLSGPSGGPVVSQHTIAGAVCKPSEQTSMDDLTKQARKLQQQLKYTQILQYVTLACLLLLIVGFVLLWKAQSANHPPCGKSGKSAFVCPKGQRL